MRKSGVSIASIALLGILLILAPTRALALPNAACSGNGESGYICTVAANGVAVNLPFTVGTDDGSTAYLVVCAYGTYYSEDDTCVDDNAAQWAYVGVLTNEPDTTFAAYANSAPNVNNEDFEGNNGFSIPTLEVADSSCDLYEYCPGIQLANGDAVFTYDGNEIIIVPSVTPAPITEACQLGVWCETSAILWNAPAGTQITILSTGPSPNISFTEPSSASYAQLVFANTEYSYTVTFPNGATTTGEVMSPASYGEVTVTLTEPAS